MKKVLQFISILKFVFLNTALSYAGTWEIITHGGFDAAVSAWNKVALIFSDSNYTALFISVAVLGAIILYLSVYTRIALGSKGNPLSGWGIPFMAGIVIYMAFIVPKDTIVIYDETLNRGPQAIDNIPRGVATIAGLLNKIETGFTDIIWTASDPSTDYRIQAGGKGFTVIGNFIAGVDNLPYSFKATLYNYIHDCVLVEMQRPNTQLNVDAIQSGTQKASFIIQQSKNPAFYTVSYLSSSVGEAKTCFEVGNELLQWQNNPNNVLPIAKYACVSSGYSFNDPNSFNACINSATAVLSRVTDNEITSLTGSDSLAIQSTIANITLQVVSKYNPEGAMKVLATSQSMSSFIGMGVHANSWIPVIKETLSALAVGLVPLFAIVCVTPLAGKAFSIMAGMFVWLTVWGIVDSVIHSFALEFAYNNASMLKSIDGSAAGVASMLLFPSYSAKIGALFGAVRWFGLMLSSIITAMFLRFGGTAMAMLAGSLSGTVQASGAAYGEKVLRNPSVFEGEIAGTRTFTNSAKWYGGIGNYLEAKTQTQTFSNLSSMEKTLNYDKKLTEQFQSMEFSPSEAMTFAAASGFNPRVLDKFVAMNHMGKLSGDTNFERFIDFQRFGGEAVKTTSTGYQHFRIGNATYQLTPQGGSFLVGADLGQYNVKSDMMKNLESRLDTKFGKGLTDDFNKLIKYSYSKNAEWGVENSTAHEFASEVAKRMTDKILHSDALKQHMDTETQHSLFATLKAGTPQAVNLVSPVSAEAGYKLNVVTKTGESKTFTVSREVGEQLEKMQRESIRETVNEFSRNSERISKLKDFAKQADAKEFVDYINLSSFAQRYSQSDNFVENAQFSVFVRSVLSRNLNRPVSYEESIEYIRRLASSENPEDIELLKNLSSMYSDYRIYSYEMSQLKEKIDNNVLNVESGFSARKGEVEVGVNREVPIVATASKPIGTVDAASYYEHANNVQTGLNNKKEILGYMIGFGPLSPVLAAPYNLGNHIYNMEWNPSFNESGFSKWDKAPIFGSPTNIYFKQQQKLNLNLTNASAPIFMASDSEQKQRWEDLNNSIKRSLVKAGIK